MSYALHLCVVFCNSLLTELNEEDSNQLLNNKFTSFKNFPFPNYPFSPHPQVNSFPKEVFAITCLNPHSNSEIFLSDRNSIKQGSVLNCVSPCPNSPSRFSP